MKMRCMVIVMMVMHIMLMLFILMLYVCDIWSCMVWWYDTFIILMMSGTSTLHYTTLFITLHYTTLFITLHYTTLFITLHYTIHHYTTLHFKLHHLLVEEDILLVICLHLCLGLGDLIIELSGSWGTTLSCWLYIDR